MTIDDRVRILWAIKGLGRGGAEVLLESTANRLDMSKFEVSCVFVDTRFDLVRVPLEQAGVRVTCLGDRRRSLLWALRLTKLIRGGAFDIVHAHSPIIAAVTRLAVRSIPSERRPRHITTEHCMRDTYHVLTRLATLLTRRLDDYTLAVSRAVLESLGSRGTSKKSLAYQGVDVEAIRLASGVASQRFVPSQPIRLLCVANLRKQKDFPTLFRAMKLLTERGVPYSLNIAGVGGTSESDEIERIPSRLGIAPNVRFLGPRSDVYALMNQHDILVASSSYEAGQIVAFEAAAVGIPIVSTRVGLMGEIFTDDHDCMLAEVGDETTLAGRIEHLWKHPEDAERISQQALNLVRDYDFSRTVTALEFLYQSLGEQAG